LRQNPELPRLVRVQRTTRAIHAQADRKRNPPQTRLRARETNQNAPSRIET
jgi:hypothetical protein